MQLTDHATFPAAAVLATGPAPANPLLPTGDLLVGYYQSWSAPWASNGANMDLANTPSYVNVVAVSFAKPDCTYTKGSFSLGTTGLQFSSDGPTVAAAIASLKSRQPNTRVLLAVGGATYTNFAGINTKCLKVSGEVPQDQSYELVTWLHLCTQAIQCACLAIRCLLSLPPSQKYWCKSNGAKRHLY